MYFAACRTVNEVEHHRSGGPKMQGLSRHGTSTARPFVFEKAWSQIKDEVRESAENEKWSGFFVTLDPILQRSEAREEPKRYIASVDYLRRDGLESKSPERPLYWRWKAPRVGRWSCRIHLHVEYASEMKSVFIRAYIACVLP